MVCACGPQAAQLVADLLDMLDRGDRRVTTEAVARILATHYGYTGSSHTVRNHAKSCLGRREWREK